MFSFIKTKLNPNVENKVKKENLEYYKKFPVPVFPTYPNVKIPEDSNNVLVEYKKNSLLPTLGFGIFLCGSLFYYYIIKQKK